MERIGAYTPETAKLVLEVINTLRRTGYIQQGTQSSPYNPPPNTPIYFRNDSGETVPAFACMQSSGTVSVGSGTSKKTYIKMVKPIDVTGEGGPHFFNLFRPVLAGKYGIADDGPELRALGTDPGVGKGMDPTVASWTLSSDGSMFRSIGPDLIASGVLKVMREVSAGGTKTIEYTIIAVTTAGAGPYAGLKTASALVHGAPCGQPALIGTEVNVIDHSGGLFDAGGTMAGYTGWAAEMIFLSLASGAACDDLTPCHWAAINRVCDPDTGVYATACV